MEKLKSDDNKGIPERALLWKELIEGTSIDDAVKKQMVTVLEKTNFSGDKDQYTYAVIGGLADILRERNPELMKLDDELKRQESHGVKPEIEVSEEDRMLLNLFREIRSDKMNWMNED